MKKSFATCVPLKPYEVFKPNSVDSLESLAISNELEKFYARKGDSWATQYKNIPCIDCPAKELRPEEALEAKLIARAIGKLKTAKLPSSDDGNMCVTVAWDGSSSMLGAKQTYSGRVCGMIEKALENIPTQIVNFVVHDRNELCLVSFGDYVVDNREVRHYLIKDFDEKSPKNKSYAYGFARSMEFCGGNKDGYTIRVLTKNILKRNEKRKILIVLSDGLPNDYSNGYEAGIEDVHEAVEEAVDAGVEVIALFFGCNSEKDSFAEEHKYMYEDAGAHIIDCDPEDIAKKMTEIMTNISLGR